MSSGTSIGDEGILNIIVHFCDLLRFHAREKMAVQAGQDEFSRPCHWKISPKSTLRFQEVFLCRT
jgi:hypothetical protein